MQDTDDDDKIPVTAPPTKDKARDARARTALAGRFFTVESADYCRPCGYPLTEDRGKFHPDQGPAIELCGDCWRAVIARQLGILGSPAGPLQCHGTAGERHGHWFC